MSNLEERSGQGEPEKPTPPSATSPGKLVWVGTVIVGVLTTVGAILLWYKTPSALNRISTYPPHSLAWLGMIVVSSAGITFACFCILFGIHLHITGASDETGMWKTKVIVWKFVFLILWVIIPPVWFCAEYFAVYTPPPFPTPSCVEAKESPGLSSDHYSQQMEFRKEKIEEFTEGQEVTSKAWLAIVSVLLGLYFGKNLG